MENISTCFCKSFKNLVFPKNNITLESIQELLEKQKNDIISEIKSDLNEKIKDSVQDGGRQRE